MSVFLLDPLRRIEGTEAAAKKSRRHFRSESNSGQFLRPSGRWVEHGYTSNDVDVDRSIHKLDTLPQNPSTLQCWSDPGSSPTLRRSSQLPWILRRLLSSIDSDLASSVIASSFYGSESHRQPNKSRQRSSGRECSLYHPNGDRFTIAHERLSDVLEAELTPSSHSKLEYMSLPLNSTSNPEEFCRNFLEFTRNLFGREATHISYFLIFFSS